MKFFPVLFVVVISGCALNAPSQLPPPIPQSYRNAVHDAAVAKTSEITDTLIDINPGNQDLVWNSDKTKILVVTWKSQESYDRFLKPKNTTSCDQANVVWVSTAPEVQQFCQAYKRQHAHASKADIELRLKQYLGLNPDWHYDVFVEMWVNPKELFRPCVDPEIGDKTCNLSFANHPPMVAGINNYPLFYKDLYFKDFRELPGVPWTGLGYTYDWGNPNTVKGASEFILIPGASYEIKKVEPTADYCGPG